MLRSCITLVFLVFITLFSSTPLKAQALAPGMLDPSFGTAGAKLLTLAQAPGGGEFRAIRTQPDAKIIAGGWVWNAGVTVATGVIARFTQTGDLDAGFGVNGLVTLPFPGGIVHFALYDIALAPDGKIVFSGEAIRSSGDTAFLTGRLNANGSLDTSFGGSGQVVSNASASTNDGARAVAVQSDGRVIVTGFYTNSETKWSGLVFRFNVNGTVDTSFANGTGAIVLTEPGGNVVPSTIVLRSDDRIVMGGWLQGAGMTASLRQLLLGYTANGVFDGVGSISDISASASDQIEAVGLDATERIIAAGYGSVGGSSVALARRFTSGGVADGTFTNGSIPSFAGVALTGATNQDGFGKGIHALPNGDVLMTGHVRGGGATESWFSARMSLVGASPAGGYTAAAVEVKPNNQYGRVRGSTLTHDSAVVLAGYLTDPVSNRAYPAIAKIGPNGQTGAEVEVVEYFSPTLVKYFMTSRILEKKVLDQPNPAGLARTGVTFKAAASGFFGGSATGAKPVRRFFAFQAGTFSTHFYLTEAADIAAISAQPWATDELIAMYLPTPDVFNIVGRGEVRACPTGTHNIWRVFKQKANPAAAGIDPNHRYVRTDAARLDMLARGYVDEGITFCGLL